jgi:hypothetical protein
MLIFPIDIASSSKADTIAVCDTHLMNVIILDYQGKVQSLYKGWGRLHLALFPEVEPLTQNADKFPIWTQYV